MKKLFFVIFSIIFFLVCFANTGVKANESLVSVRPILTSENFGIGYFSYTFSNSKHIKLSTSLKNNSKKKVTVHNYLTNASNNDGMIDYKNDNYKEFSNLQSLKVGSDNKKITLKAHQKKKVTFEVKTPKTKNNFIVLGGIKSVVKTSAGKINYVTSVLLKNNNNLFNAHKVKVENFRIKKQEIEFKLHNQQNTIMQNANFSVKLFKDGKQVGSSSRNQYSMIPNSTDQIKFSHNEFKPGIYKLIFQIDENGEKKQFEKIIYYKINPNSKLKEALIAFIITLVITFVYYILISLIRKRRQY